MRCEYPRGLRGPAAQDALLIVAWVAFLALAGVPAGVRSLMLVAIPIVLAWEAVSLHFPSRVEVEDDFVAFARYGRVHRFAWSEVRRLRVRRFLLRDRVLVTIEPSGGAWRGRYWIVDSLPGFDRVVSALERGRIRADRDPPCREEQGPST
jgi:hypothetical protein